VYGISQLYTGSIRPNSALSGAGGFEAVPEDFTVFACDVQLRPSTTERAIKFEGLVRIN
jgi:short subunit dehydrogenase-like uncharacterized protein